MGVDSGFFQTRHLLELNKLGDTGYLNQGRQNLVGGLWMIGSMAGFAIEDSLVKLASQSVPIGEVLVLLGVCGMMAYSGALLFTRQTVFHRAR